MSGYPIGSTELTEAQRYNEENRYYELLDAHGDDSERGQVFCRHAEDKIFELNLKRNLKTKGETE